MLHRHGLADLGAHFVPCSAGSFTVTSPLIDGAYIFQVRATDAAGNSGIASFSFQVITAPPVDACTTAPLLDNVNRGNGRLGSNWAGVAGDAFYKIKN